MGMPMWKVPLGTTEKLPRRGVGFRGRIGNSQLCWEGSIQSSPQDSSSLGSLPITTSESNFSEFSRACGTQFAIGGFSRALISPSRTGTAESLRKKFDGLLLQRNLRYEIDKNAAAVEY